MSLEKIIFIVGPTAIGKSDVALHLARKIKGEIISCDSMQLYREIAIASNKPSREERKKVPHHLLDLASVTEEFDVARFYHRTLEAIKTIQANGAKPIIVGGSGLYMQILLDGIFAGERRDEAVRANLKATVELRGAAYLHGQLKLVDPAAAQKIHPNDSRRIIRALEVFETSRRPITELQRNRQGLWDSFDVRLFGLRQEREILYRRINERVERMFAAGLVEEIRALKSLPLSRTAVQLIGVKEVLSYIRGRSDLDSVKEEMKQNTRRLAKKQMTWFRKEKRIVWFDVSDGADPQELAGRILPHIKKKRAI